MAVGRDFEGFPVQIDQAYSDGIVRHLGALIGELGETRSNLMTGRVVNKSFFMPLQTAYFLTCRVSVQNFGVEDIYFTGFIKIILLT